MHHFIYPSQDTYITNRPNELDVKNFGVDEILQVGTQNSLVSYISSTKDYVYVNTIFDHIGVQFFNGQFTGSIVSTNVSSSMVVKGTGSYSASYFTGYIDGFNTAGAFYSTTSHGIDGYYSGDFKVGIDVPFEGTISSGSLICLFGTASGVDTRHQRTRQYTSQSFTDRALIQFNLTAISQSIVNGDIVSASFHLKVKVANEFQLPIDYTIYAYPISESWVMGNGYMSDGGSTDGASWIYRDFNGGTPWSASGGSLTVPVCSQSFHYKSADIDMDVSPIVNAWLAGLPNYGFLLISSDELHPTGSGFILKYFSEDTNTIYSPLLDVAWSDWTFSTGSFLTASVTITSASGSNSSVVWQSSSFTGAGGVYGNFRGASVITTHDHYITASNMLYTGSFIQQFTGSFSGSFYGIANATGSYIGTGGFSASFTGSVDGIDTEVTNSGVIGSNVAGFILGDVSMPSVLGTFSGSLLSSGLFLNGYASGIWLDFLHDYFIGFISASGFTGNINGVPVIGAVEGLLSTDFFNVIFPNEFHYLHATSPMEAPYGTPGLLAMFPPTSTPYTYLNLNYVWGGDQVGWQTTIPIPPNSTISSSCGVSHSVQLLTGSFYTGPFGGDQFLAYYENYFIPFGNLTGSWNSASLVGATVVIPLPQVTYPYVTAFVNGPFIFGRALGLYTISGSTSASFTGQFVDGQFIGGYVNFQLSGSQAGQTSSFSFTSSIQMTSSFLDPLDTGRQFSINLQNLQPTYKAGDLIKVNVFARPKFPIKDFAILTQQQAYLVPNFLPTSSFWALKDNQTDEIVVNFDNYTQISCKYPEGNFFFVDTTSLPQERYYRILIRVDDGVQVDTIDTGKTFKITR